MSSFVWLCPVQGCSDDEEAKFIQVSVTREAIAMCKALIRLGERVEGLTPDTVGVFSHLVVDNNEDVMKVQWVLGSYDDDAPDEEEEGDEEDEEKDKEDEEDESVYDALLYELFVEDDPESLRTWLDEGYQTPVYFARELTDATWEYLEEPNKLEVFPGSIGLVKYVGANDNTVLESTENIDADLLALWEQHLDALDKKAD